VKAPTFIGRLRYYVADAWDEWRHSPGVNLLALGTLTATLFVSGLVLLVLSNLQHQLLVQRDRVLVHVYLKDDTPPDVRAQLSARLAAMDGVADIAYIDKTEALRRYREWAGQLGSLIAELDTNPLPTSLEVTLVPGPESESRGEAIVTELSGHPAVEEARFDREWLRTLASMLDLARVGGGAIALVVLSALVFVMASVLRLAVYARREEIDIMLLVGATPGFVRGPFLVAGVIQGLLGGVLAVVSIEAARRVALVYAGGESLALLDLVLAQPLGWAAAGLLLVVGLVVSLISAFFAVRASV
jgi:cell division transport system permease protein